MKTTEANEILAREEGWRGFRTSPLGWVEAYPPDFEFTEPAPTYHRPEDAANLIRVMRGLSEEQRENLRGRLVEQWQIEHPTRRAFVASGITEWLLDLWLNHLPELAEIVAGVVKDSKGGEGRDERVNL